MAGTLKAIVVTLIIVALTGCAPNTEEIQAEVDSYWTSMSEQEQEEFCNAYFLFGPTDLKDMMHSNLAGFAQEQGIGVDEAERRIDVLVNKAGEECL